MSEENGRVITGGASQKMRWLRHPSPRLRLFMIVGVLLLLLGGTIAYIVINRVRMQDKKRAEVVRQDKQKYDQVATSASALSATRNADGAITQLNDYADKAVDPNNKALTYIRIGGVYQSKNDFKTALEYFRKAEALIGSDNLVVSQGIANSSRMLGDKPTAIKYYKLVIAQLEKYEKTDPSHTVADITMYKILLAQLESGQ